MGITDRDPLLEVEALTKHFPVTRGVLGRVVGHVRAVDGVSFDIARGETLGLVGESGSGKTTVGRSVLRLIEPTSGRVTFEGKDVTAANARELRELRRRMQIVFQDPYGSLNPRLRVVDLVGEAIEAHGLLKGPAVERRVAEILTRVGLSPSWINRYPHEFSGGQRQRLGVARAIALEPKLIICDEPVSALDVSIQAQVVNLLKELGRELSLSYLFIAHDLSVVRHISHRVGVLYLGEMAELAPAAQLFEKPAHPYTRALLSAIPVPDPKYRKRRLVLAGEIPSPLNPPSGCRFHTRCPAAFERCPTEHPELVEVERGHGVRCFHAYDVTDADWFRQVDARIEQRVGENANRQTRPKPKLAALAALPPAAAFEIPARDAAKEPPRASRRSRRSIVVLTSAVVVLALWAFVRVSRANEAKRQLDGLAAALDARKAAVGAYPAQWSELGWRLPPVFRGGAHVDPWGRPWQYRPRAEGRGGYELRSLGPDGVPSADDVVLSRPR